jgi:hypothetical protein
MMDIVIKGFNPAEHKCFEILMDDCRHSISEMAEMFKEKAKNCEQAASIVRNGIRRLVRDGWAEKVSTGTYHLSKVGRQRIRDGVDETESINAKVGRPSSRFSHLFPEKQKAKKKAKTTKEPTQLSLDILDQEPDCVDSAEPTEVEMAGEEIPEDLDTFSDRKTSITVDKAARKRAIKSYFVRKKAKEAKERLAKQRAVDKADAIKDKLNYELEDRVMPEEDLLAFSDVLPNGGIL